MITDHDNLAGQTITVILKEARTRGTASVLSLRGICLDSRPGYLVLENFDHVTDDKGRDVTVESGLKGGTLMTGLTGVGSIFREV